MDTVLIFAALGGAARGLVGFTKHRLSYKNVEFKWPYFLSTVAVSAGVGFAAVWALVGSGITFGGDLQINPGLAFIIGYAGGDAVENIYKLILRKPILDLAVGK